MEYYAFIQNDKIIGTGQCKILNEDITCLEIKEELYNAISENRDKYVYRDGEIVLDENNLVNQLKTAREELLATEQKLVDLDYIGIKIATGRATIEDYADKIAEMNTLADKVNELRNKISELEEKSKE